MPNQRGQLLLKKPARGPMGRISTVPPGRSADIPVRSGVRPSSGAAGSDCAGDPMISRAFLHRNVAAPEDAEDGRTPVSSIPQSPQYGVFSTKFSTKLAPRFPFAGVWN